MTVSPSSSLTVPDSSMAGPQAGTALLPRASTQVVAYYLTKDHIFVQEVKTFSLLLPEGAIMKKCYSVTSQFEILAWLRISSRSNPEALA